MSALWLHSDEATCIHPGWLMIESWDLIHESWEAIFQNQGAIRVWPDEIAVHLEGGAAWVTCIENIDASRQLTDVLIQAQATNVFRLVAGQWKMVHHHSSPLPQGTPGASGGGISPN